MPVNATVAAPMAAVEAAVSVRFRLTPGLSVSVDGLAVTPEGNPLRETVTLPVKPFSAVAVTETGLPEAPAVSPRLVGEMTNEKSGAGAAADTVSARDAV